MRITDPRWPAVREFARILLRTEALVVHGPKWLGVKIHALSVRLGDVQPSRTVFPAFEEDDDDKISLMLGGTDRMLAQCTIDEPSLETVWVPMETDTGWTSVSSVVEDLLNAGYPGCLGCGGSNTEGEWDETNSRITMNEYTKNTP